MDIKKRAHEDVIERICRNLEDVRLQIRINKREINTMSNKQRILKKERAELSNLISYLNKNLDK